MMAIVPVITLNACNSRPIYPALDVYFFCTMLSFFLEHYWEAQDRETKTLIVLGLELGSLVRALLLHAGWHVAELLSMYGCNFGFLRDCMSEFGLQGGSRTRERA